MSAVAKEDGPLTSLWNSPGAVEFSVLWRGMSTLSALDAGAIGPAETTVVKAPRTRAAILEFIPNIIEEL